jgi:uncharacterized membrane protein
MSETNQIQTQNFSENPNPKNQFKLLGYTITKNYFIFLIVCAVVLVGSLAGGYVYYENKKEQQALATKIYNEKLTTLTSKIKGSKDLAEIKMNIAEAEKIDGNPLKNVYENKFNEMKSEAEKRLKKAEEDLRQAEEKQKARDLAIANPTPLPEYKVVKRDSEELKDKTFKTKGKIVQLQMEKIGTNYFAVIRLDISGERFGDDMLYLNYLGEKIQKFEGDIIEVVITGAGDYTYTTTSNGKITLPSFKLEKIL